MQNDFFKKLKTKNNLQKNSVQDADKDGAEVMNCL